MAEGPGYLQALKTVVGVSRGGGELGLPWTVGPSLTGRVQGPSSGDWGLGVRWLCSTQALPPRFHTQTGKS